MRIGIVPAMDRADGGVYQYSLTMLQALHEWKEEQSEDDFVVFADELRHPVLRSLNGRHWKVIPLETPARRQQPVNWLRRIVGEGLHRDAWRWIRGRIQPRPLTVINPDEVRARPDITPKFLDAGVELVFYPQPQSFSFEVGIPYVMAIHDLQHRLQPEFPEVSANGEWQWREYLFRNGARYANLLLADSEVGKEDILHFYGPYGVTAERIKVLPFLPACYLGLNVPECERQRVRKNYKLPDRFLFYPAQFWPHKNHLRVIEALGLLKDRYDMKIPVMFCGSRSGAIRERNFNDIMSLASKLRLQEDIRYLGYVPDEDMSGVYSEAVALAMPTFFGPTNIPILEAWALGCPVLTSDIRGIREQVGDAALLVDPRSVDAIADGIHRLWTDETLGKRLADLGRQRLASYTPDDYRQRLGAILEEAKDQVKDQKPRRTRL
jgi:glycosyltransferase involved in cell wall biosynthesis